jgi:hypothetical protein
MQEHTLESGGARGPPAGPPRRLLILKHARKGNDYVFCFLLKKGSPQHQARRERGGRRARRVGVAPNPTRLGLRPPHIRLGRSVPFRSLPILLVRGRLRPSLALASPPQHRNCPASAAAARARSSSPRRLGDAPVGDVAGAC